ncbi:MAG: metal-dependent hydrolase [Firmicutes bacterium]|nr:metal-dependent hydrolase [Bacillota bacterium]
MTGKSHKTIGVATGLAFTIYGVTNSAPEYAIAMLSAPFFAMLPDIDHNHTKIGKIRQKSSKFVVAACILAFVATAIYYGWYLADYTTLAILLTAAFVPIALIFLLSKTKFGKSAIKFTVKHRGIMHTLILPAGMLFFAQYVDNRYFLILIYGCFAGYLSHIVADCLTKHGCPIFFPLTTKNISIAKVSTGTKGEIIASYILIAVIVSAPILLFLLNLYDWRALL